MEAMRIVRRAAAMAVALCLAVPGAVSAATPDTGDADRGTVEGVRYRIDPGRLAADAGATEAVAGCGDPRWHLIGGGARVDADATAAWLSAGRPVDGDDPDSAPDDGWFARGTGARPGVLTTFAICIRDGFLRYRSLGIPADAEAARTRSVGCANDAYHATTGGASIVSRGSWVASSSPVDGKDADGQPDDAWRSSVFDGAGGTGRFRVDVVCVLQQAVAYRDGATVAVPAGGSVTATVRCPRRAPVVGGGAKVTGPADGVRLVSTAPIDGNDADRIPDDGWRVRVQNLSDTDEDVTPHATCLP
jgi:hypothetical protein